MILLTCPNCGERNVAEFRFGGEYKQRPRNPEDRAAPASWTDYLYLKENKLGPQKEWWYHREGCGIWFAVYRDTCTNLQVHASVVEDSKDK